MSIAKKVDGVLVPLSGGGNTPVATTLTAGKVKPDGITITIAADGTISGADTVPIATTQILGKVRPDGSTITIDRNGIITATSSGASIATPTTVGVIKPDNETILVDQQGVISANEFIGTAAQAQAALSSLEDGATLYITDDSGSGVPIATTQVVGKVKPDGSTITIDENGTISTANNESWVEYTILSSGWNNKQYSLETVYPSLQYDIINVLPTQNTTDAQCKAWADAKCSGYNTQNIIIAKGTVPSIDIVIGLCIKQK